MSQEIDVKGRFVQIGLEGINEGGKVAKDMMMADGLPGLLPEMLLGIQFRTSWREIEQLSARIVG
jgi:hypothetical protein